MQASPSKARAQAIASHSWSIVHAWLSGLYHPSPVPAFERNAATLKALQSLMAENIAANRVRELLFEAKVEELAAGEEEEGEEAARLEQRATDEANNHDGNAILSFLETSLASSAQTALESLASSVVLLGWAPQSRPTDARVLRNLSSQIVNIPRQTFAQESQLSAVETLTATLQRQRSDTQRALASFAEPDPSSARPQRDNSASPSFPPTTPSLSTPPSLPPLTGLFPTLAATDPSHLHGLTLQHQRETKQLTLKSAEYKSRIDVLERHLSRARCGPNLSDDGTDLLAVLASKQRSLGAKKRQIEALEGRIRQFHGLPPDVDVSRAEVRRAQGELDRLRRRRDELFEAL